jgi:hypothetical protein
MGFRDTRKTSRFSLHSQARALDIMPHRTTKKHKAKERQEAKKLIRLEVSCKRIKDENT